MSSKNIESTLIEERQFPPPQSFAAKARLNSIEQVEEFYRRTEEDNAKFWGDLARQQIAWKTPFKTALDDSKPPHYRWFHDGTLNVSFNCLDRNLAKYGKKTAEHCKNPCDDRLRCRVFV